VVGTVARVAAVAVAAASWSAAAALLVDSSGALAPTGGPAPAAAAPAASDPCALREPLSPGNDARCTFELARSGARPLVVDLDQRWSGNVLTQWLNVREPDAVDPVHFVFARTAGVPQPARVNRLFPLRSVDGGEHLVYVVGRCGGTACPSSDLVVVGPSGGQVRTLLTFRLGPLADVEIRERAVVAIDGSFPDGAQRPDAIVARSFAWDGSVYAMREVAKRPPPSPTASPR
jgi:hypothetical protein